MEDNPFNDLKISDSAFLDQIAGRTECPKCGRTRKYYCYTCYVPMTCIKDSVPKVSLPIKVDVIKHPCEVDGKSTAVHAGVVASEDVTIYTYPVIPDYSDPSRVMLIFPGEESVTLEELAEQFTKQTPAENSPKDGETPGTDSESQSPGPKRGHSSSSVEEPSAKKRHTTPEVPFDRVVFIDSTWNQTMKIYKDERLKGLKQVELKSRTTKFWRHQRDKPNTYLATIEAIYYFIVDYHKLFVGTPDDGQYDNLLFFFSYMYKKIRTLYDGGKKLKAYQKTEEQPIV